MNSKHHTLFIGPENIIVTWFTRANVIGGNYSEIVMHTRR